MVPHCMDMREVLCGDSSDLECYLVVKDVVSFLPQVCADLLCTLWSHSHTRSSLDCSVRCGPCMLASAAA